MKYQMLLGRQYYFNKEMSAEANYSVWFNINNAININILDKEEAQQLCKEFLSHRKV